MKVPEASLGEGDKWGQGLNTGKVTGAAADDGRGGLREKKINRPRKPHCSFIQWNIPL